MKLYSYWRSSSAWRVRIAFNLKGLSYDYVPVNLEKDGGEQNSAAYRAINPMRTVPTLEFSEGGQTRRLTQSLAILEYLEERHPSPALLPADPYLRARCRMLAELVNSGIQPLQSLAVLQRIKEELRGDDKAWRAYWIDRGLAAFQTAVQETAGTYCMGSQVSFADLCLVPQLFGARRCGLDLGPYKLLTRIEEACNSLPAFQAAHPDRQPDALPT